MCNTPPAAKSALLALAILLGTAGLARADERETYELVEITMSELVTDPSSPAYNGLVRGQTDGGWRTVRGRPPNAVVRFRPAVNQPKLGDSLIFRLGRRNGTYERNVGNPTAPRYEQWGVDWKPPPERFRSGEKLDFIAEVSGKPPPQVVVLYTIGGRVLEVLGQSGLGSPVDGYGGDGYINPRTRGRTGEASRRWRGGMIGALRPWTGTGDPPPLVITVRFATGIGDTAIHYVYRATNGGSGAAGGTSGGSSPASRGGRTGGSGASSPPRGGRTGSTGGGSSSPARGRNGSTAGSPSSRGGRTGSAGGSSSSRGDRGGGSGASPGSTGTGRPGGSTPGADGGGADRRVPTGGTDGSRVTPSRLPPWAVRPTGAYPPSNRNPGGPGGRSLLVARGRGAPGAEITVPVFLYNPGGLRNINFEVRFDPSVVEPLDREPRRGQGLPANVLYSGNVERGRVRIGLASSVGMQQSTAVAYLRFRIVGRAGQSTALSPSVREAELAQGDASLALYDGRIDITRGDLPGDVNRNGELDAWDAQAALDMSTGKRAVDLVADMDRSGDVTSKDARLILDAVVAGGGR